MVGCVAPWLGCWSLAVDFSQPVVASGDHFVGKLSALGQPTQPSLPCVGK